MYRQTSGNNYRLSKMALDSECAITHVWDIFDAKNLVLDISEVIECGLCSD